MNPETNLLNILAETSPKTGDAFFRALVKNLSQSMDVAAAWVTEYVSDFSLLRTLAFRLDGKWMDSMDGIVKGTPCEVVIRKGRILFIADEVADEFPDDPDLAKLGMTSYVGVPFKDSEQRVFGHLAVMDRKPIKDRQAILSLIRIFASRAGAELRRIHAEERLRQREEKLARLLDTAPDAIVEVDRSLNILTVNMAARNVFEIVAESHSGLRFTDYLAEPSIMGLREQIDRMADTDATGPPVWVPDVLTAVSENGKTFPAEVTLSKTSTGDDSTFILILRNINDRLLAEEKIHTLNKEAEKLREEIRSLSKVDNIIGTSVPLMKVLKDVDQVAATDASVLISGETGTGKELFARAIHDNSLRGKGPLIRVNCAAIPEGLLESEFFGHEKGAFTGATRKREGRFAMADGTTIFLDEVGELSLDLQAKLLRVLQEGEFEPVGSTTTRHVDVRVIAATNRDLQAEVVAGRFREDLYFRLSVFPLTLPPLRDREDDVVLLAEFFAKKAARRMGRTIEQLSAMDKKRLNRYSWPGNVRELQNVIERAVITAQGSRLNLDRALPEVGLNGRSGSSPAAVTESKSILTAAQLQELERDNLLKALTSTGWRVSGRTGAARLLGIPPSTLNSRIKALGLKRPGSQ
jgi:PAS domain S-box-containing protein